MTARPAVRRGPRFSAEEILQGLSDAGIDFWLANSFRSGRLRWGLANIRVDRIIMTGTETGLADAADALRLAAIKHFPESDFARRFGDPA